MSRKGTLFSKHPDTGETQVTEIDLPIETYAALFGWGLDFWLAYLERPKILRWIARKAMGRYAYRELYGIKESIGKYRGGFKLPSDYLTYDYNEQDYHNDKIPT